MSKIIFWIKKETVAVEAMETKLLQTRNELSASTLSSVSRLPLATTYRLFVHQHIPVKTNRVSGFEA